MKRPSFQFYPSDWLRDTALRSCSVGARGLWMDMLCFMHEGYPYGHLKVGSKVILAPNLAGMVGATLLEVEGWLCELLEAGVYDLNEDGVILSRRMVKDENLRLVRAAGGKLGGNPGLRLSSKVNLPVNHTDDEKVKQKTTPSSSSSSSKEIQPSDVSDVVWADFVKHRKAKKAAITQTAVDGIRSEAKKVGWTMESALAECCTRGWTGFKADWVRGSANDSSGLIAGAI